MMTNLGDDRRVKHYNDARSELEVFAGLAAAEENDIWQATPSGERTHGRWVPFWITRALGLIERFERAEGTLKAALDRAREQLNAAQQRSQELSASSRPRRGTKDATAAADAAGEAAKTVEHWRSEVAALSRCRDATPADLVATARAGISRVMVLMLNRQGRDIAAGIENLLQQSRHYVAVALQRVEEHARLCATAETVADGPILRALRFKIPVAWLAIQAAGLPELIDVPREPAHGKARKPGASLWGRAARA